MKKQLIVSALLIMGLSLSLSAAEGTAPTVTKEALPLFLWTTIAALICLSVTAIFGAFAQTKSIRTAVENIGRNPAAADSIRTVLIIGLALIESLVIYVLMIDLILFFIKWGKYTVS